MRFMGERLRQRRKDMNISIEEVCVKTGIQRATLNKYERNIIKNITVDIVGKLSKAVQCSPKYLLDLQDDAIDRF